MANRVQDPEALSVFERLWHDPLAMRLAIALAGVVVVVVVVRVARSALARRIENVDTRYRLRKFLAFVGYVVAVLYLAVVFQDKLGGLTFAVGIAGAGIAFALQELIASVGGWVTIAFGHVFRVGDRVQMGGIRGDVIDIGVLRTTLMELGQWVDGDLYNGRVVRISNSAVFKDPIFNYSGDFEFLWDEIKVPIKYGSDRARARQILESTVREVAGEFIPDARLAWRTMVTKYRIEDASVEPLVSMVATDNWIEFSVRYVVYFRRRRVTKDRLFERILDELEKTQGAVSLASATFEVVGLPRIEISERS